MIKLVLLRHGQSVWNLENRFTGWTDVDLSPLGQREATQAGVLLREAGFMFDCAYTSVLKRAIRTLWMTLDVMDLMWIPVKNSWRLNERHYGDLQGLNKSETAARFGEHQVAIWRRSYDTPPPPLKKGDPRDAAQDPRYYDLTPEKVPLTECLKETVERVLPWWYSDAVPALAAGKRMLVAAHGNSLRALVKYLDEVSDADIVSMNIPTGIPLVYELDSELKPVRHYYLGDPAAVEAAMSAVANQGRAKE